MTKSRFLALVTALALLLAIPTAVFAQRVPPHVFVGSVTLDGATAADGAAVTAWIDGEQVASTTASGGTYSLVVDQADSAYAGKTVSFKVSGAAAAQTAEWVQGGGDELNLVADSTSSGGGGDGEKGDAGAKGAQGPKGSTGATGPAGPAGPAGADGKAGANGKAGAAGADGSDGATGPAGAAGAPGADGGGGALGVIALIVAIVALVAAGGAFMAGRRA
jgi:hypothetical protein